MTIHQKSKLLPLESLRGLAAVVVTIYHFKGLSSPLTNNIFVGNAYLMVDFFFVLSGFVIALNYQDRIKNNSDVFTFIKKRFWRLYPLHLITLFAFLGIECAKYIFEHKTGIQADKPAFLHNDIVSFLNNLVFTHAIFLDKPTFNSPSWSISTEFYTYILFSIVVLYSGRRLVAVSLFLAASSFLIIFISDSNLDITTGIAIFRCIYSFFMGVICFSIYSRLMVNVNSIHILPIIIASIMAVIYLPDTNFEILIPMIFCILVIQTAKLNKSSYVSKILHGRFFVYLGTISYSLYLTHFIVWWVVTKILRFVFKIPTYLNEQGDITINLGTIESSATVVIALCITIFVSHITYKLIEDYFRHGIILKKRFAVNR